MSSGARSHSDNGIYHLFLAYTQWVGELHVVRPQQGAVPVRGRCQGGGTSRGRTGPAKTERAQQNKEEIWAKGASPVLSPLGHALEITCTDSAKSQTKYVTLATY